MVQATPSQQAVFTLLYDQQDTSASASGTITSIGEESNAELKLNKNEVAEIKYLEVETPIDSNGAAEALEYIRPFIDGKDYQGGDLLRLRADNDSLIPVPRSNIAHTLHAGQFGTSRVIFDLGLTLPEIVARGVERNPNLILENTTIKTREAGKIDFKYEVGNSAITDNFRVKAWGIKYTDLGVADRYVRAAYGGGRRVEISDFRNGRTFSSIISPNYRKPSDFTKLIGGNDESLAGNVSVKKFNYWARNSAATTASKDYALSFDDSQVDDREQNMDIEIDDGTLYWIRRLGVRPHSNHLDTKIEANDVEVFKERIRDNINHLEFGRTTAPSASAEPSDHRYKPIPTIPDVFGHNETLKVMLQDSGSTIADGSSFGNGSLVVWDGLKIEDPNFKVSRGVSAQARGF